MSRAKPLSTVSMEFTNDELTGFKGKETDPVYDTINVYIIDTDNFE